MLSKVDSERTYDVRLAGWEQFHDPVDRIVSIEAFEHFGFDRYDDFFKSCFDILPDDGRMTHPEQCRLSSRPTCGPAVRNSSTLEFARFIKFMITEIFPGGRIPTTEMMVEHGEKAGVRGSGGAVTALTTSRLWVSGAHGLEAKGRRRSRPPMRRTTTGTCGT